MAIMRKPPNPGPDTYGFDPTYQEDPGPLQNPMQPDPLPKPPKQLSPSQLPKHEDPYTETPRERLPGMVTDYAGPRPGGDVTPRRPMTPTPLAASPQVPLEPFNPLPQPDLPSLVSPRRRGLLGGAGGLTGGGIGVTGNNPAAAVDISELIKQILGGQ